MANILSTIAGWFGRQRTSQVRVFTTGTTEVYPNIDSTTAIQRGFNGNSSVYAIVKKDAKKFGSIPRYVEGADDEEITGTELDKLLNQPNEYQG